MDGSVPGQKLICTFTNITFCMQSHGSTFLSTADKPHTISNTANVVKSPNWFGTSRFQEVVLTELIWKGNSFLPWYSLLKMHRGRDLGKEAKPIKIIKMNRLDEEHIASMSWWEFTAWEEICDKAEDNVFLNGGSGVCLVEQVINKIWLLIFATLLTLRTVFHL